jgi:hypothetical protein
LLVLALGVTGAAQAVRGVARARGA